MLDTGYRMTDRQNGMLGIAFGPGTKALFITAVVLYASLFVVLNVYLLNEHPLVNADEPWLSDAPLNFISTGHFSPTMFHGTHYNLDGEYRWWFYQLLLAPVFRIFGFGVYQARLL